MAVDLRTIRSWCCVAVLLLCAHGAAGQDAVKLSEIWIEPVTVIEVRDGNVRYQTEQGVVLSRPVSELQGLRLSRYPQLGEAFKALEQGEDAEAAKLLEQVDKRTGEGWVGWYAKKQRIAALIRSDEVEQAVGVYVDLVVSEATAVFIDKPPVDALAQADASVRLSSLKLLNTAIQTVDADRAEHLQKLIDAAGNPPEALDTTEQTSTPENVPSLPVGSVPALSASVSPGSAVNLYRQGRFEQALATVDEALSQPGRTAAELYLKGMCQLAIAEKQQNEAGYKSAGLSFMRVVTYYPRSAVVGPAWLETAWVHHRIGRTDLAKQLIERARPLIHSEEDPAAFARLNALATELNEASPTTHGQTEESP